MLFGNREGWRLSASTMCWRNPAHSASGATIGPPIQNRVAILPSSPAFWWHAMHFGIRILDNVHIIVHNTQSIYFIPPSHWDASNRNASYWHAEN